MTGNKIIKRLFAASLITLSLTTTAFAVNCPSAEDVKNTADALNAVIRPMESVYMVLSTTPLVDENEMAWMVITENKSTDFDTAFASGNASIKGVVANVNTTAVDKSGTYLCAYLTTSGVMNVEAISPKNNGSGCAINPTKLDLHGLMQVKFK